MDRRISWIGRLFMSVALSVPENGGPCAPSLGAGVSAIRATDARSARRGTKHPVEN
jgi:hypothetical protein